MKYIFLILFLFSVNSLKSQTYFQKYQKLADSLETVYGIPSSIMMSIAYHESGGGKSFLAKSSNNHFGIKGKNHKYKTSYRYFESDTAAYKGFCDLIAKTKFYGKIKGEVNHKIWVSHISNSGYAGKNKRWKIIVLSIINKYNLM